MFFIRKLKLIQENIKLLFPQVFLPVIISIAAILVVILSFAIFAQRILFIYDPYTIKISGYNVSQIKKAGIRNHLFIKPIETRYEDFHKIYENLSEKEKQKKIIMSAYLYSMLKDNEEYKLFFNNSKIHIYGPFFDYKQNSGSLFVSTSISNQTELKYFLKECNDLIFFISEPIYEKPELPEPENTFISLLTENFYSLKNNGDVIKLPFSEKNEKNKALFESNSVIVFCFRKVTPVLRNLIKESGGKAIFFDYINSYNLKESLYSDKDIYFFSSLSYDYKDTLDKIFKNMGENSEKGINYIAIFAFFQQRR